MQAMAVAVAIFSDVADGVALQHFRRERDGKEVRTFCRLVKGGAQQSAAMMLAGCSLGWCLGLLPEENASGERKVSEGLPSRCQDPATRDVMFLKEASRRARTRTLNLRFLSARPLLRTTAPHGSAVF